MVSLQYDENGWAVGAIAPFDVSSAYCLFSPESDSRLENVRLQAQAERFFKARLSLLGDKQYPGDSWPVCDAFKLGVSALSESETTEVRVQTMPLDRADGIRAAADKAVARMGGAGFDVLLGRAQRLWQVECALPAGGDQRAPLVVAAVLASHWLAPILAPDDEAIFGVRGARVRLERLSWRA